ncbi:MAG: tetraacyldisaccharide 4'-kinase [Candidatus Poribacteria bacterium]|nr:tetraacyldisaccharide 4'-kinase [Candidatus Poribacteria bacterium]
MKRTLYTFITTKQRGIIPIILRPPLMPLSWLYGAVIWIRNYCFTSRIFKQKRLPCTVISVGNIVAGGTGKTPAVAAIAKQLQNQGFQVAILLRGYKRRSSEEITVVSDGENRLCSREESGDEADMLARQLSDIPIIVGKQRYLTGKAALDRFKSDVIILDDGFQHRQLARDVDILIIDTTQPYGTGALLPIGTLREPVSALQRADIIILTRTDAVDINIVDLKAELNQLAPNTPILESVHQPASLYWLNQTDEHSIMPIENLTGKRLLAVCGIGNPDAFVATLEKYNPEAVGLLAFPDHHVYTESDLQQIQHQMQQHEAEWVITTQKDEQKFTSLFTELPLVVLAIELVITDGEDVLMKALQIQ